MAAPEWAPPRKRAKKPKAKGVGVLWRSWLWVSWFIFPAAFLFRSFAGVGGWESLFAVLFSPLIVPGVGLLGAVPRFVLKHRGFRSIPVSVGVTIVTSCWGLVMICLSMPGATDAAPIESVVRATFGFVSQRAEETLLGISFIVWVGAYLAALVLVFVLRPAPPALAGAVEAAVPQQFGAAGIAAPDAEPAPAAAHRARRSNIAALIAVCVVPAMLIGGAVAADYVSMNGERDFGGQKEIEVAGLSLDQQRDRHEAQWREAQEALAPLRTEISPTGWRVLGGAGIDYDEYSYSDTFNYQVDVVWGRALAGDPESVAKSARKSAEQQGWMLREIDDGPTYTARPGEPGIFWEDENGEVESVRYEFENERGYRLSMTAARPDTPAPGDETADPEFDLDTDQPAIPEATLALFLSSGDYWQSRGGIFDWFDVERTGVSLPKTYASDQWPTLMELASRAVDY